jgi:hypothetical protein
MGLLDRRSGAMRSIELDHAMIHDGYSYYYHDVFTLASAGTQVFLFTTPSVTTSGRAIHFGLDIEGVGITTVEIYEASDRVGTTLQTIFNRNRLFDEPALCTIHKGVSGGSTDGTRIYWKQLGYSQGTTRILSAPGDSKERVLKSETKYLIRVTSGNADNRVSFELDWYELPLANISQ